MKASALRALAAPVLLASLTTGSPLHAATYEISSRESRIRFEIGHEHYSKKVRGRFTAFTGTVDFDPGLPEQVSVDVTIDPDSISTGNGYRDGHLREAFFETGEHPTAAFSAIELRTEGESLQLVGELTLKGVTRELTLELSGAGHSFDAEGRGVIRYRATGRMNRRTFGVEEDADRTAGMKKLLAQIQEGLDELIAAEVELSVFLVARER